jgi:hypothetical protein
MSPFGPPQIASEPELAEEEDEEEEEEEEGRENANAHHSQHDNSESDHQGGNDGHEQSPAPLAIINGVDTRMEDPAINGLSTDTNGSTSQLNGQFAGLQRTPQKRRRSDVELEEKPLKRTFSDAISISETDEDEDEDAVADDDMDKLASQLPAMALNNKLAASQDRLSPVSSVASLSHVNDRADMDKAASDVESRAPTPSTESDENGEPSKQWLLETTSSDNGAPVPTPRRFQTSRTASGKSSSSSASNGSVRAPVTKKVGAVHVEDGGVGHNTINWSALDLPERIKVSQQVMTKLIDC